MEESYKITYHKNNPTVDAEDVELYAVWKSRADLTEEDEGIDWSQKTLATIMSNLYSLTTTKGVTPNLEKLAITAVYTDGSCRELQNYTTNLDTLETDEDTYLEVEYSENAISKMLQIPVRVKEAKNPGTEDPGTEDPGTEDPGTEDPSTPENPTPGASGDAVAPGTSDTSSTTSTSTNKTTNKKNSSSNGRA